MTDSVNDTVLWIGAATSGPAGSPAAGLLPVRAEDGRLSVVGPAVDVGPDPMFLTWLAPGSAADDGTGVLLVAHETDAGELSAWRAERTGLQAVGGRVPAGIGGPCHLTSVPGWVLLAGYTGGGTGVVRVDGTGPGSSDTVRYPGSGPHPDRQRQSHAHQVVIDAARDQVLVVDLGTDRVHRHRFDAGTGTLTSLGALVLHAGAGPRHLVVHGDVAYVANELDATVSVLDLTAPDDDAERVVVPAHSGARPADAEPAPSAIRLSADGRHLYVAVRGPDTVSTFAVDGADEPALLSEVSCGGAHPRDMVLSPDGAWLWVANQLDDGIATLARDPERGTLSPTEHRLGTPSPTCLLLPPA